VHQDHALAGEGDGQVTTVHHYFKVYAPKALKRELRIEAMDSEKSTTQYTREIVEERLPHDVRMALRARAEREGMSVQQLLLEALASPGMKEAATLLRIEKKRR